VAPKAELPPHAADLGMIVYKGKSFPEKYRGGIFRSSGRAW
jgi:glucose/arabinose dehydrogenase